MTKHRPLIRREYGYWRIYLGRTDYHLGDYYTTPAQAADAARHIWNGHR